MWLCAGITSLSFKYSHCFKVIVIKLKQRSQSAGNFINNSHELNNKITSETLRYKSTESEHIHQISIHVPKHLKPRHDIDFGHYLAGLIDGDGHFSKALQLVLVFNELDASLAYFIKSKLGYGNIYKVKNKKAIILVVSKRSGLLKILNLINGKIRSKNKLNQINNNILVNDYFKSCTDFSLNYDINLNNYWLSGFSDADASFQIKLINRNNKTEVRLNFQIDQKKDDLLILIKNFLGGNIGYRKSQDNYYYSSTSFGSARNVINYFNRYHLLSHKYVHYLKWRKNYCRIMENNSFDSDSAVLSKIKKTSKTICIPIRTYSTSTLNPYTANLNPFWVTGFSDGDSCFNVKFHKRHNFNWQVLPVFQIGLQLKDKEILCRIKSFFNDTGIISVDGKNNKAYLTINKIKDLNSFIIPHFEYYPLQSDKKIDFNLWAKIVKIIISKEHLNRDGFLEILSLKTILNRGLSKKLSDEFPSIIPLTRPLLELSDEILNNHWNELG